MGSSSIMPYVSVQSADYDRLSKNMNFFTAGVNLLLNGHKSKVTIAYENRPVFFADKPDVVRKGSGILQYQISF
ncbi:MAG: hypothetical protein IPO92_01215 [Saprospiraceae bacterium]|nr:hypothetical protein [Saprospiraceae bacterium]